jgi:hypothetical protein
VGCADLWYKYFWRRKLFGKGSRFKRSGTWTPIAC